MMLIENKLFYRCSDTNLVANNYIVRTDHQCIRPYMYKLVHDSRRDTQPRLRTSQDMGHGIFD